MTALWEPSPELADLVDAVCCGESSAAGMNRLMELTLADEKAMQYYVRAVHLHANLPRILHECGETQPSLLGDMPLDDALASSSVASSAGDRATIVGEAADRSGFDAFHAVWSGFAGYVDEHPMTFSYIVASVLFVMIGLVASHVYITAHSALPVAQNGHNESLASDSKNTASNSSDDRDTKQTTKTTRPVFVARVTGEVDCRWQLVGSGQWSVDRKVGVRVGSGSEVHPEIPKSQNPEIPNSPIALGDKLTVASGLLELTYDAGSKVILDGPCTFKVGANGGFLSVGRLTGQLDRKVGSGQWIVDGAKPQAASNQKSLATSHQPLATNLSTTHYPLSTSFVIATPTAVITDLGTEFGVDVSRGGDTTSHVFRGQISVRMVAANGRPLAQRLLLGANESVQVAVTPKNKTPTFRHVPVDTAAFVRVEQFPKITKEMRLRRFAQWQAYSEKLRCDPSLVAYYDFQRHDDAPGVLFNVAANGGRALDGKITHAEWSVGRMHGKQSLEFDGRRSRVDIRLPQRSDDITLAAWVCMETHENSVSSLLMSNGWNRTNGVYWYFRSNCAIDEHLFFNVVGARGPWRFTPEFTWEQYDRWMHVAVVFDHTAKRVLFYKNGKLIDAFVPQGVAAACIGEARIGNWVSSGYTGPDTDGGFCGRIDELAIFGRVLRQEEIQAMVDACRIRSAAPVVAGPSAKWKSEGPLAENQHAAAKK